QLIGSNASRQLAILWIEIDLVHLLDQVESAALLLPAHRGWRLEIENGAGTFAEDSPLIDRRQKAGAPAGRPAFGRSFRLQHDAIGRQVFTDAAQAVSHPGSET